MSAFGSTISTPINRHRVCRPAASFQGVRFQRLPACHASGTQIAPRLGASLDIFGNGRTALKGGVYKYNNSPYLVLTQAYSPLTQPADRRTWRDLNLDDVAQDAEIGASNNLNFLTSKPNRRPDPNLKRPYVREYTVSLQHQVAPGVAVSGSWDLRQFRNLIVTRNALVGLTDYTPFTINNPYDNTPLTVFRLNNNKQGQVDHGRHDRDQLGHRPPEVSGVRGQSERASAAWSDRLRRGDRGAHANRQL